MARDLLHHLVPALAEDYRIERELGAGATAKVYLAHDLKHDRMVALKVLRPELALAVGAERFLREIQTAARLSHPGILPLYDSGEADGLLYFTMPFVEGESLRDLLEREKRLPIDEAVRITCDVADALAHAHACGVIHRDIKPENILLAGGRPLVADFGIALALEESESERLTHTGMVVGTPPYMSPEQSAGLPLDQRSDVYSLACVLYEMLAGQPPFVGPTLQAIVARRRTEAAPAVSTLRGDVPAVLEAALAEALAKDPADRFATTAAFATALTDPARRTRRLTRRQARRARIWAGAGAGIALLSVAGALVLDARRGAPLDERDWVLMSDFDGPPSDPSMARVVRDLVTAELNQSRYLSTMPRQQLAGALHAAGYADTTTVNVELARNLAFRKQVRAVVGGSVAMAPDGYALSLVVVDAADGHGIARAAAHTAPDSVVSTVQRLARDLREQLGERRSDLKTNQYLMDIATPSLPAYRKYVEGVERKEHGDMAGSTRALRSAIALDTGFAAAWALMGRNYIESRSIDSARLLLGEALRRPKRLGTAQRFALLADAAYAVDHDLNETVKWYGEYLKQVPRSVGGRNNRGVYLSMLGRYEDALADFDTSAANNPFGPEQSQPAILNAAEMLIALGRLDRAEAKAEFLSGEYATQARLRLASARGQWTVADSIATRAIAATGVSPALRLEALTTHASALAARGAVAAADGALADAAADADDTHRRWYESARSLLSLTSGRPAPALSPALLADGSPGALVVRGVRLALLGDTAGARALAQRVRALPPDERARLANGTRVIDALVALTAARPADAIAVLGEAARIGEYDDADLDRVPSLVMRWIVADAQARLGRRDSAVAVMREAVDYQRRPYAHRSLRGLAYPFAHLSLAHWLAADGHMAESRDEWASFAQSFTTPDLPLQHLRNEVPGARGRVPNARPARAQPQHNPPTG